jgi:hypothetical protein
METHHREEGALQQAASVRGPHASRSCPHVVSRSFPVRITAQRQTVLNPRHDNPTKMFGQGFPRHVSPTPFRPKTAPIFLDQPAQIGAEVAGCWSGAALLRAGRTAVAPEMRCLRPRPKRQAPHRRRRTSSAVSGNRRREPQKEEDWAGSSNCVEAAEEEPPSDCTPSMTDVLRSRKRIARESPWLVGPRGCRVPAAGMR